MLHGCTTYWIVTFNVVDIFGYDPHLATVNFSKQVVLRVDATKRPLYMPHGPDSVHVRFPFDGDVRIADITVRDPLFTAVFLTMNPGRATIVFGVAD